MRVILPSLVAPVLEPGRPWFHRDWLAFLRALLDRANMPLGSLPFAYPLSFSPDAALTTALNLAANGGSIAVPVLVPAQMSLVSVSVYNTDTLTARSWRWDLYQDVDANSLRRIASPTAAESFTPVAASIRTLAASSVRLIEHGLYWIVIQSTHATSTFGLGSTAASAAFAPNTAQTKTTTNPNGDSLDFVAATWTKVSAMYAIRLNGAVFGQSAAF